MNEATIPLLDVQARWAYSEITESHFTGCYDNFPDVGSFRAKRKSGQAFSDFSKAERYQLATMCFGVRLGLMSFFVGIESYRIAQLTRAELARLLVPPTVWGTQRELISFEQYLTIPTDEARDARVLANPNGYQTPADPLTIGRLYEHAVLIDGYHRAVCFWKFAPDTATVPSYFPIAA